MESERKEMKDEKKSNKEWAEKKNGEGTTQKPAISWWGDREHYLWQCEEGVVEKSETKKKVRNGDDKKEGGRKKGEEKGVVTKMPRPSCSKGG